MAAGTNGARFRSFSDVHINSRGQVAFSGGLEVGTGDTASIEQSLGIWRYEVEADRRALVARSGQRVPGSQGDVRFDDFRVAGLTASGAIAFGAKLDGESVDEANDYGLWLGAPGDLTPVLREGGPAPGLSGWSVRSLRHGEHHLYVNAAGDLVFDATLEDARGASHRVVYFHRNGTLEPVAWVGREVTASVLPAATDPPIARTEHASTTRATRARRPVRMRRAGRTDAGGRAASVLRSRSATATVSAFRCRTCRTRARPARARPTLGRGSRRMRAWGPMS